MAEVRYEGVHKLFGQDVAVEDLNLTVADGEFLVLVGPSGCGKTTSLRMLAGFERPSYGRVWIGERCVNTVAPKDRDIAMVFQSYALFPHMSVRQNLAFGTKVRREPKAEARSRIADVAELLGLTAFLDRKPAQLSGGQRQRVALGRAIVRRPAVFLMDEPLSNLDAALRVQMRAELGHLHERFGVTTVYVTHDQVEAMTMGDRIAVMLDGRLQQVDTPETLYDDPATLFVATFIGSPKMNVARGRLTSGAAGEPVVECLGMKIPVDPARLLADVRGDVLVGIRPEDLLWKAAAAGRSHTCAGEVDFVEPMGHEAFVTVRVGDESLVARFPPRSGIGVRDSVELALDPERIHLFDVDTKVSVLAPSARRAVPAGGWTTATEVAGKEEPHEHTSVGNHP
jgi:multiple sugar transport system ATP-binding protein